MGTTFPDWESYFYPETYNPTTGRGTLQNLFGERDAQVLGRLEYVETTGRFIQLQLGDQVPKTFGSDHVCAIHQYLFQDVYEWAGFEELLRQMHHSPVLCEHSKATIAEMTPA